jgi:uncharacterized membrane protein
MNYKVSYKRHIGKTISWRIIGTIDTIILGWLITGHLKLGLAIGGVEVVTKMILYFLHERIWYKWVKFGLVPEKKQTKKDSNKKNIEESVTKLSESVEKSKKKVLNYSSNR